MTKQVKDDARPQYIAVTNAHGWGKGDSIKQALSTAWKHSANYMREKPGVKATVWRCRDDAYVDGMGYVYGVPQPMPGVLPQGTNFERRGNRWAAC